ncbi:hypothetical protein [Humibacter sp.]|nr:hypothetical protein [Humibacter sp.]
MITVMKKPRMMVPTYVPAPPSNVNRVSLAMGEDPSSVEVVVVLAARA